ncbi:OmpA family protein [Streptomyces xiamenensis]|uniref:OmpA family protein n=1 Tax=Streptomyces xiamenensis TaxID=408015 RepID=UPI0036E6B254
MTYRPLGTARVTLVAAVGTVAVLGLSTPALADDAEDDYQQPPGYEAPAVPDIDANAPGLMLGDGATLAEPRVLDIKFITEDLGTAADPPPNSGGNNEDPPADPDPEPDPAPGTGGGEQREERTGGQHKFTLQTDVVFGKNSDEISEESRAALAEVAAAIDEYQPEQVNVFGFTDNLGSYENGVTLSANRARNTQTVLLELIEDPSGISFNVRGYSEDYPLYDNETEEGRQKNRRVEISWPSGN